MTEAVPAYVIDFLGAANCEDDIVITDVSRDRASTQVRQQLEKWKQKLRIGLIHELFKAQNNESRYA